MNNLLLIVTIAGSRVALRASAVKGVVELDTLIPVPRAAPHIAGLSALRSRVLTVIDCRRSLDLGPATASATGEAVVAEVDGHHYALLVDLVEDVIEAIAEPTPIRASMSAGWSRVSLGMIETGEEPLLLVDVAALVAGPDLRSTSVLAA
jgi:purine-binding chemotaxis protein CheW